MNSSVGQVTPAQTTAQAARRTVQTAGTAAQVAQTAAQVARTAARIVEDRATVDAEVMEIDPPARPARRVDYLSLLAHISKLGTKQFAGTTDPIDADEWRSRLTRNFSLTRCPEEYKKDRLESQFLDLTQGRMTVREYEEKFNRFRRYVSKELEDEMVQVRRFIRGLRVELRTYCSVGTYHTVSELVEKIAMVETNLAEEAKLKSRSHTASSGTGGDRKRKIDSAEEGRTSSGRPECSKCGRRHGGECWKAMGACTCCGKMDHSARDCPRLEQSRKQGSSGGDTRGCHYCGKAGHFKRECPKLQAEQEKGRGEASKPS